MVRYFCPLNYTDDFAVYCHYVADFIQTPSPFFVMNLTMYYNVCWQEFDVCDLEWHAMNMLE